MIPFYRTQTPNGFRIYRTRTFISQFHPPADLKFISTVFEHFRLGLKLFWNVSICRYMLYREYKDVLVLISVIDGPELSYREPGEWILWAMRKGDILKAGNLDPKKALKKYENELMDKSEKEKHRDKDLKCIQEEMQKDWEKVLSGHIGLVFKPSPKKFDPKKIIGIDPRTRKQYRLRRKKHGSDRRCHS